jgi:hypothetical protein
MMHCCDSAQFYGFSLISCTARVNAAIGIGILVVNYEHDKNKRTDFLFFKKITKKVPAGAVFFCIS